MDPPLTAQHVRRCGGPERAQDALRNAAAAYDFDLDELRTVSDRIGPRVLDVLEPSTEPLPELRYTLAFRHSGAWS